MIKIKGKQKGEVHKNQENHRFYEKTIKFKKFIEPMKSIEFMKRFIEFMKKFIVLMKEFLELMKKSKDFINIHRINEFFLTFSNFFVCTGFSF